MAGSTTLYPPINHPLLDKTTALVTEPWALYFQRLVTANTGNAPVDAEYLVGAANGFLTAERVVTNTSTVTWDLATAGQAKADVVPQGPDTAIQFNDGGDLAGSVSATLVPGTGAVSLAPTDPTFAAITLGMSVERDGDYVPVSTTPAGIYQVESDTSVSLEINPGQTPPTPVPFTSGIGLSVTGPAATVPYGAVAYEYGGLGTGAVPGMTVYAERNTSGSGAASTLGLEQLDGTDRYIWFDNTGAPRYGPARPTEDGSVSDTSGTLFGAGGGSQWSVLTNGDVASPEIIFAGGDVIMLEY